MVYIKSLLVGVIGAIVAAVLWILVSFILPLCGPVLIARFTSSGSAGTSVVGISEGSVLLAGLAGFVTAGLWSLRRSRLIR
jgi:hypothetical protein